MKRSYTIKIGKQAQKSLQKIEKANKRDYLAIKLAISNLADNPRPSNHKKLQPPYKDFYRIRIGNYRCVYTIKDSQLLILVVEVKTRENSYCHAPKSI